MREESRKAVRESKAKNSAWAILKYMHAKAQTCVVGVSIQEMIAETRFAKTSLYRDLHILEKLEELVWIQKVRDKSQRFYHLVKICPTVNSVKETCGCRHVVDLTSLKSEIPRPKNIRGTELSTGYLFPPKYSAEEVKEVCKECQGTGYKNVPKTDGSEGVWAVPCPHTVARMAGVWRWAQSQIIDEWERQQSEVPNHLRGSAKQAEEDPEEFRLL